MGRLVNKFRPYARILLVIWIILIIGLALLPELPVPRIGGKQIPVRLDYPVHFLEHTALAFLAIISFVSDRTQKRNLSISFLVLILFAAFAEILHLFIHSRTFEFYDLAFNIAGIISGTAIAFCLTEKKQA